MADVRRRGSLAWLLLVSTVALTLAPVHASSAADAASGGAAPPGRPGNEVGPGPTSYSLIQAALAREEVGEAQAAVLLARAIYAPRTLPARFRAPLGRDATLARIHLEQARRSLRGSPARVVHDLAGVAARGKHWCDSSVGTLPNELRTKHFVIWYDRIGGGLTIDRYAAVLEQVWKKEVGAFGWARPPSFTSRPAPGGKYPVRIADAGAGVYGYVAGKGAHAGVVGDNPATGWDEGDAWASCMVLNPGFSNLGSPNNLNDLKVTVAHEFLHSIQFGLGVITVDANYVEGAAAWIEDEIYDAIDDNYQYLYPIWDQSMGAYPTTGDAFYGYWLVWRGLTESYGSGPGGAEDVMQRIFEGMSKAPGKEVLPATSDAFEAMHTSLSFAYHQLAIAALYMKPCGGGYVPPLCFEEAAGYRAKKGPVFPLAGIVTPTNGVEFSIRDDYAAQAVRLPDTPKTYPIYFRNESTDSPLFWSVVCDTGTEIKVDMWGPVEPGKWANVQVLRKGCVDHSYVVITNQRESAPNPVTSYGAAYKVWVPYIPMKGSVSWTVSGSASGADWSESWTESGSLTFAAKRDPQNVPDYLVVDDGSSYSVTYSRTRTEHDPYADCTTTFTGSGSATGAPNALAGFIGSTYPNLDPPNPTDAYTDLLGLGPGMQVDFTDSWSGCGSSGTYDPVTKSGPFFHGLDAFPPCVPAALAGHEAETAGWALVGAWIEGQSGFDFGCSDTLPVSGGSQTITVSGTVTYPTP